MRCKSKRSMRIASLFLFSSARYLSLPSRYTTRRILIRRRVAIKPSTRVYRRYRFRPNIPLPLPVPPLPHWPLAPARSLLITSAVVSSARVDRSQLIATRDTRDVSLAF
jgi:hypothetical protein